jgi:RNA polymerase sigma-70 factor (ECF subfamily)
LHRGLISDAISRRQGNAARSTDEELAALLRARIPEAWETLYERHFDHIYRYALARLGDPVRAEDIASATFQRALSGIDRYSYPGKPIVAWLYGIARNVLREEYRAQQSGGLGRMLRSVVGSSRVDRANGLDAHEASIPDIAIASVNWMDLNCALTKLTESQREVILLRYLSGLSAAETTRIMGKPESAVYALQARALKALRRHLI